MSRRCFWLVASLLFAALAPAPPQNPAPQNPPTQAPAPPAQAQAQAQGPGPVPGPAPATAPGLDPSQPLQQPARDAAIEPVSPELVALRSARDQAATRAFDMAWLYYSENRVGAGTVYIWSRRKLDADREESTDKTSFVAAYETHLARIKKLETKIKRIRQLGFGNSLDVLEVDYYIKEAETWLAEARMVK